MPMTMTTTISSMSENPRRLDDARTLADMEITTQAR
jgi:hypothetical protein